MGTRNLTMVISGGKTKVAQYGQWDGYPSGQGATVLSFLQSCNIEIFKKQVDALNWITDEEGEKIDEIANWEAKYPYLSRNCGAQILNAIHYSFLEHDRIGGKVNVEFLQNSESFANDSLMCEWCYVVDLDNMALEVYTGFNKEPLPESERFFGPADGNYYPVRLAAKFSIESLPTLSDFVQQLEGEEVEEEA